MAASVQGNNMPRFLDWKHVDKLVLPEECGETHGTLDVKHAEAHGHKERK